MDWIYVLDEDGHPLMPTRRQGHIRRLLNKGKAKIVSHVPFVVQLKYKSPGKVQTLIGGTDPGRTNIGEAVLRTDGTIVYKAKIITRNLKVPQLMAKRRRHRQASRRGERLARKRLAKRLGTTMEHMLRRRLPGYPDGSLLVKDIINSEARFNNRVRPDGWLTPTARQLVQTHLNMVRKICQILPVTYWSMEVNRFAFMQMDGGQCYGADFQNGRMKDYPSVQAYVYARQEGKCFCCGGKIEHYHHVLPKHLGGSDLPENLIGVCRFCHEKIHTGKLTLSADGIKKKYGALSVLNQAVPYILKGLVRMFGEENVGTCFGDETKDFRDTHHLNKDHDVDAVCIACIGAGTDPGTDSLKRPSHSYPVLQFRRHDRQLVRKQSERTYYLSGKKVCKNRHRRFEQKELSLAEYRQQHPDDVGRLTVKPSKRSYNNTRRLMPGAVFLYKGKRYVFVRWMHCIRDQCKTVCCVEAKRRPSLCIIVWLRRRPVRASPEVSTSGPPKV